MTELKSGWPVDGRDVVAAADARYPPSFASADHSILDRLYRSAQARWTQGVSPTAITSAWMDWATHFLRAPGKQLQLAEKAGEDALRLVVFAAKSAARGNPEPLFGTKDGDHRFDGPEWASFPYNVAVQSFLSAQDWWRTATDGLRGMSDGHNEQVSFMAKQFLCRKATVTGALQ